ncbi:uncharacterized protein LOC127051360 [Gopherus flavomarginatus]|uniref:uncharacterized protein LOC127051360 n=1 Tax=Gopherus flavomarginatus TaxID=286002 RepID=UPI0021CBAA88|nr:uncharacterized protein LOC127051360 [Gopherus flavomarginatus]
MRYLGVTPPPIRGPRWTLQSGGRRRGRRKLRVRVLGWEGDTPESQEACSQELFSSQEEGSQSQQLVLGEGQAEERVPVTLSSQLPMLAAQRLQNLWKKPQKSKDDLLQTVMNHSARENRKTAGLEGKGKQDPPEKRSGQEEKHKAADKHPGAPSGLYPGACSHAGRALPCRPPHPVPKLFPLCPNVSSKPPSPASRFLPPPAASNTCTFTNQP